jgi:hypothetical protein
VSVFLFQSPPQPENPIHFWTASPHVLVWRLKRGLSGSCSFSFFVVFILKPALKCKQVLEPSLISGIGQVGYNLFLWTSTRRKATQMTSPTLKWVHFFPVVLT